MTAEARVLEILREAKTLAQRYRRLTGKPLGVTGEVAEYEAATLLGIELMPARQDGYDAIEHFNGTTRRLQIKGRCLQEGGKRGQRLGAIKTERQWDAILMVLLDQNLETTEIWEADRAKIVEVLSAPGSKARNERGAMSVSKFRAIGRQRWPRPPSDIRAL
jgi:hypothetical protein